jgi:hypothetical protein
MWQERRNKEKKEKKKMGLTLNSSRTGNRP